MSEKPFSIDEEDWSGLTEFQRKFLCEAEAGYFAFGVEDGESVWATGAPKTGTLFSMEVEENPISPTESSYFPLVPIEGVTT